MLFFKSKRASEQTSISPAEPIKLSAYSTIRSLGYAEESGKDYRYSLAIPNDIDQRNLVPVVVYLHGAGGDENSELLSFTHYVEALINECQGQQPLIVFPGNGNRLFQLDENYHLAEGILNDVAQNYAIAGVKERIIVGFSLGGAAATRTAILHPNRFSLSVSWAGGVWPKDTVLFDATKNNREAFRQSDFKPYFFVGSKDAPKQYNPLWRIMDEYGVAYEKHVLKGQKHDLGLYLSKTREQFKALLCSNVAGKSTSPLVVNDAE